MKWVKPYVLNIIVAMNVSLRNEIEVTNGDVNKKKLLKKKDGDYVILTKM